MRIQVFGPGCARCAQTEALIREVVAAKGGDITVEKVTDMKEMMAQGIMSTPAVAVDGVVKSRGKIPAKEEITAWIDEANAPTANVCSCNTQGTEGAFAMKPISITPVMHGDTGACCASAAPSCCSPLSPTSMRAKTKEISIDFLYLDLNTCERCIATGGTLDEALNALAPAFQSMHYATTVNKINITTKEMAEQHRFMSSPTIRVNGVDICTELKESDCKCCGELSGSNVDCRVFVYDGIDYEQPPAAMIIDGIMRVLHGAQVQAEQKPYMLPENLVNYFNGLHRKSGQ